MTEAIFLGCSKEQRNWGSHTGDDSKLEIGRSYTIAETQVHSWHTKLYLEGIEGSFNSACFEIR